MSVFFISENIVVVLVRQTHGSIKLKENWTVKKNQTGELVDQKSTVSKC